MAEKKTQEHTANDSGVNQDQLVNIESLLEENKQLQDQVACLQAELKALNAQPTEVAKPEGVKFEFRGENYQFAEDAPAKILFEERAYTQAELAKDEDAIAQLIGAEHPLIQKK